MFRKCVILYYISNHSNSLSSTTNGCFACQHANINLEILFFSQFCDFVVFFLVFLKEFCCCSEAIQVYQKTDVFAWECHADGRTGRLCLCFIFWLVPFFALCGRRLFVSREVRDPCRSFEGDSFATFVHVERKRNAWTPHPTRARTHLFEGPLNLIFPLNLKRKQRDPYSGSSRSLRLSWAVPFAPFLPLASFNSTWANSSQICLHTQVLYGVWFKCNLLSRHSIWIPFSAKLNEIWIFSFAFDTYEFNFIVNILTSQHSDYKQTSSRR